MSVQCSHGPLLHLPPTLDVTAVNLKNNSNLMHYSCVHYIHWWLPFTAHKICQQILIHMRVLLCNGIDSQLPVVIYHPCVSSIKDSQLPDGNLPPLFTASKCCPSAGFLKMQYEGLRLYRAELPKHNHIELKVTLIYISEANFPGYIFSNPIYYLFWLVLCKCSNPNKLITGAW